MLVKLEDDRCGLPSFKVLGASWATVKALEERLGIPLIGMPFDELARAVAAHPDGGTALTLVCATDGNHGRAVARMANLLGLSARILVPAATTPARRRAILDEGADLVVVDGSYDDAVAESARVADAAPGQFLLVSDTAWPGYEQVPSWVIEGYSTILLEVDEQAELLEAQIDLVAVPVGVGAFAKAVVQHYRSRVTTHPPRVLTVEPVQAACLLASLTAGTPVVVPGSLQSVMAGLSCGAASSIAWPTLQQGVDLAVTVTDDEAIEAVQDLAALGIPAGESGAAALAGVAAYQRQQDTALTSTSTVLLLVTEGVTDPAAAHYASSSS